MQQTIKPCPECGGQRVSVKAVTYSDGVHKALMLEQPERSAPFFSSKTNITTVVALTCLVCGYTAMYATEPANLMPD